MPDAANHDATLPPAALPGPDALAARLPCGPAGRATVAAARTAARRIIAGDDDRLLVVVGPCSIHDPESALDYARRLRPLRAALGDRLEVVMRVYLEKPRTTLGWKGLVNDPHLDGSCRLAEGLATARRLLADIAELGVPAGTEFLDPLTPAYLADLVSWGAIGARTTESQVHRELASGLPCPVGFKNATDGNVRVAAEAMVSAAVPHHVLGLGADGRVATLATRGNPDTHAILRGGRAPNYDAAGVAAARAELARAGVRARLMVDASHGNSGKDPDNQPGVVAAVAAQVAAGEASLMGVMIEGHIHGGRQEIGTGRGLAYGRSVTDACLDWPRTVLCLEALAEAAARRRAGAALREEAA